MYPRINKINISNFLFKLLHNISKINNRDELINFFIENSFNPTIDRSWPGTRVFHGDDSSDYYKEYDLFSASFQSEDGMNVSLEVYYGEIDVEKVKVCISSDSYFRRRKINIKFNSLLENLKNELGDSTGGLEFIPVLINVLCGHVWFKLIDNRHLNIFLINNYDTISFEFENIQPDDRMRNELDATSLHLNRVLDNFNEAVALNPNHTALIDRRDNIKKYINAYIKSSNEQLDTAVQGLVNKWNKKLGSNIIVNQQENSPISMTGDDGSVYLRQGVIYINKDNVDEGYNIVNRTFHVTPEEYKRMLFFETPKEADIAGYEPSEYFISKSN